MLDSTIELIGVGLKIDPTLSADERMQILLQLRNHGKPTQSPQPTLQEVAPKENYITKAEVAARLGMTARTIEHWMRFGILPYLKIGKGRRATVFFKWVDIEAHLKANYGVGDN